MPPATNNVKMYIYDCPCLNAICWYDLDMMDRNNCTNGLIIACCGFLLVA
eukprot:UN07482